MTRDTPCAMPRDCLLKLRLRVQNQPPSPRWAAAYGGSVGALTTQKKNAVGHGTVTVIS